MDDGDPASSEIIFSLFRGESKEGLLVPTRQLNKRDIL